MITELREIASKGCTHPVVLLGHGNQLAYSHVVGGGGIGEALYISIGRGDGAKTIAIIILLFVTVICVDGLSGWLRRRLVGLEAFAAN